MTKAYIIVGGVKGADLEKRAEGVLVQWWHLRKFVKIGKKPSFGFDLLRGCLLFAFCFKNCFGLDSDSLNDDERANR
jgi:hypothetical protein